MIKVKLKVTCKDDICIFEEKNNENTVIFFPQETSCCIIKLQKSKDFGIRKDRSIKWKEDPKNYLFL